VNRSCGRYRLQRCSGGGSLNEQQKRQKKRIWENVMPMTLQQPKRYEPDQTESRADDLIKRIRKLRWMGLEREAEELQAELTGQRGAADTVIGTPRETD
jgi:hypothetical protein